MFTLRREDFLGPEDEHVSVAQGTEHRSPKAGVARSNRARDTTAQRCTAYF